MGTDRSGSFTKMLSPARIAVTVALLATCGLSQDDHRLADFLRLQSGSTMDAAPAELVGRIRDVLFGRIRCGSQQGMPSKMCQECLSTRRILNITHGSNAGVPSQTTLQDLGRASVVIMNYMLSFQTSCTMESIRHGYVGSCRLYEQCVSELHGRLSPMKNHSPGENLEALEGILREVKAVFEPDSSKQDCFHPFSNRHEREVQMINVIDTTIDKPLFRECFSAEMVLSELNENSKKFDSLPRDVATVLLITGHMFSGECIDVGESVADFLDDIFLHYGDGCERVMSQSGFTKLWNDLQLQRRGRHIDHGVQKNACVTRNTGSRQPENTEMYTSSGSTEKLADDSETYPTEVVFGDPVTGENNSAPLPARNKSGTPVWTQVARGTTLSVPDGGKGNSSESSRNASDSEAARNPNLYLVEGEVGNEEKVEVVTANIPSNRRVRHTIYPEDHEHKNLANECLPSDDLLQRFLTPGNKVITSSAFLQLCPALVQQTVSGVCSSRVKFPSPDESRTNDTTDVLQQVASNKGNPWYAVLSVTIITAASLCGLFLLPVLKKSFFVHINGFFTGLAFGTMSGDVVLHIMPQYLGLHKHDDHDHDHESESLLEVLFPSHLQRQLAFLLTMYVLFLVECLFAAFTGQENNNHGHSHGPIEVPMRDLTVVTNSGDAEIKPKPSLCSRIADFLKPSNLLSGISSKAAVIILADTIHNFADGIAIAVGFSTSYKDGVSTSIAVLFHELPHEIGDFAVLMNSGMGYWKAFVFNILSGLTAFLGLGVGVFTAGVFREWLLCITAGLFFFVVMVELLPDMRLESRSKWKVFVVKIMGTVLGISAMICIAMYELYAN